jgi:hypothetical protein
VFRRLSKPLALLIGGVLLSGCSGEENIPLKKMDGGFVIEPPPKDYKEQRKAFMPGTSAKIGHDPFGIGPNKNPDK